MIQFKPNTYVKIIPNKASTHVSYVLMRVEYVYPTPTGQKLIGSCVVVPTHNAEITCSEGFILSESVQDAQPITQDQFEVLWKTTSASHLSA